MEYTKPNSASAPTNEGIVPECWLAKVERDWRLARELARHSPGCLFAARTHAYRRRRPAEQVEDLHPDEDPETIQPKEQDEEDNELDLLYKQDEFSEPGEFFDQDEDELGQDEFGEYDGQTTADPDEGTEPDAGWATKSAPEFEALRARGLIRTYAPEIFTLVHDAEAAKDRALDRLSEAGRAGEWRLAKIKGHLAKLSEREARFELQNSDIVRSMPSHRDHAKYLRHAARVRESVARFQAAEATKQDKDKDKGKGYRARVEQNAQKQVQLFESGGWVPPAPRLEAGETKDEDGPRLRRFFSFSDEERKNLRKKAWGEDWEERYLIVLRQEEGEAVRPEPTLLPGYYTDWGPVLPPTPEWLEEYGYSRPPCPQLPPQAPTRVEYQAVFTVSARGCEQLGYSCRGCWTASTIFREDLRTIYACEELGPQMNPRSDRVLPCPCHFAL